MKTFLLFAVGCMFCINIQAQMDAPSIQWSKCFGGGGFELLSDMRPTSDGGFILAGTSFSITDGVDSTNDTTNFIWGDAYVVKVNKDGNRQWSRYIGGRGQDFASSIIQTSDGGYLLTGHTNSISINGIETDVHRSLFSKVLEKTGIPITAARSDAFIIKLSRDGEVKRINCVGDNKRDDAWKIISISDGNYMVLVSNDKKGMGVLKIDEDGTVIKEYSFKNSRYNNGIDIVQSADGSFILASTSSKKEGDKNTDAWIIKFDESGAILKELFWGGEGEDFATSILAIQNNQLLITCTSNSRQGVFAANTGSAGTTDSWIVTLSKDLEILQQKNFGGSDHDGIVSIISTKSGYIACGSSNSTDRDALNSGLHPFINNLDDDIHNNTGITIEQVIRQAKGDSWIIAFDKELNILWQHCYGGSSAEGAIRVLATGDEYVFANLSFSTDGDVEGHAINTSNGDTYENTYKKGWSDYWIVRLNSYNKCSPDSYFLSTPLFSQKANYWCWAAIIQMTTNHFGIKIEQCELANDEANLTACCNQSMPDNCDIPAVFLKFEKYGLNYKKTAKREALTWDEITTQIGCKKSPIVVIMRETGSSLLHTQLIYGYKITNKKKVLYCYDPYPTNKGRKINMTYEEYTGDGPYQHSHDYYNFSKK